MTGPRGVPAGRAGRVWLRSRLSTAERAVELLDRKLTLLRVREQRLDVLAQQARSSWQERCRDAETWFLRAVMLGGQRAALVVGPAPDAEVEIVWSTTMGLRYPAEGACVFPDWPATAPVPGSTALVEAVGAHRAAVESAVRSAVAESALLAVRREIALTARRRRAIDDRWIPSLTDALRNIEMTLDELERGDAVRLRWAARRSTG